MVKDVLRGVDVSVVRFTARWTCPHAVFEVKVLFYEATVVASLAGRKPAVDFNYLTSVDACFVFQNFDKLSVSEVRNLAPP